LGADLLALASLIATAALLLDGISILLTTLIGMTVLAFYHPVLLAFDIGLTVAILLLVISLSRREVATAVDESLAKHALVRWLEQLSQPGITFHSRSGMQLGSDVAASLTAHYLEARTSYFRIVFRQLTFGLAIQVLSLVLLLGLGGWLVINGQMTLGQLVAAALLRQRLRVEQRAGRVVMEWVGHADSAKVRHYFHLHDEDPRRHSALAILQDPHTQIPRKSIFNRTPPKIWKRSSRRWSPRDRGSLPDDHRGHRRLTCPHA
jgi:ABC-type protease/lipase transport system fused ATPase/permease subunit